jgi:Ni,Fe-hydrogenase I large subunit
VLFVTILQGVQIDTDHWRHFYLMLGLVWGLAAQTRTTDVTA